MDNLNYDFIVNKIFIDNQSVEFYINEHKSLSHLSGTLFSYVSTFSRSELMNFD